MQLQPYRIPLQPAGVLRCNDRNACPPPRPGVAAERRPHVLALVILASLFAGSVPVAFAAGQRFETRGHVEIEPAVLERELRGNKGVAARAPVARSAESGAFSILADGVTHDPFALTMRARALRDAGTPIGLLFVGIDRATRARLRAGEGMPIVEPVRNPHDGLVGGLQLGEIPEGSPLRALGLVSGDMIVSANGWQPKDAATVYDVATTEPTGTCVLEIVRGSSRLVVNLWWSGA
jgi:hypothetical protein